MSHDAAPCFFNNNEIHELTTTTDYTNNMDSFSNTNHTNQTNTLITTDYADNMDSFSNTNRTNQTNTSITISWEYIIREIRVIRVRKRSVVTLGRWLYRHVLSPVQVPCVTRAGTVPRP